MIRQKRSVNDWVHTIRIWAYIIGIAAFFLSMLMHSLQAEEYSDEEEIEYCEEEDETYGFAWGGPWVPDWLPHPIVPWDDPRKPTEQPISEVK